MAVRQPDFDCVVNTAFEFDPINDGDEAGLTVYISNTVYYSFCKIRENGVNRIRIYKNGNTVMSEISNIADGGLRLKITASKNGYELCYAINDAEYNKATKTTH